MALAALLALADSRLPAGGHAHSAGTEQAVLDALVTDEASLATWLRRRLATSGVVAAHLAAAACARVPDVHDHDGEPAWGGPEVHDHEGIGGVRGWLAALDDEADARIVAPAARDASRAQGRGLARVARTAWPHPAWTLLPRAPHHPVALGVAAAAGGCTPEQAALVAAYLACTAPATAAARLLGLDPVTVAAVLASLAPAQEAIAAQAALAVARHDGIPMTADVLADVLATRHAPRREKLFAS